LLLLMHCVVVLAFEHIWLLRKNRFQPIETSDPSHLKHRPSANFWHPFWVHLLFGHRDPEVAAVATLRLPFCTLSGCPVSAKCEDVGGRILSFVVKVNTLGRCEKEVSTTNDRMRPSHLKGRPSANFWHPFWVHSLFGHHEPEIAAAATIRLPFCTLFGCPVSGE
jgi:hypothetical protein